MDIYLVRHGETDWNQEGLVQGRENIELNANGIRQAELAAAALSLVELDEIVSSPLSRAEKTAEIIASKQKQRLTVKIEKDLIERDYGELSGKAVTGEDKKKLFMDLPNINGLEKMEETGKRMESVFKKYAESGKESVLMVSHGAASNALLYRISHGEIGGPKTWLVNTCINHFTYENGEFSIKEYNLSANEFSEIQTKAGAIRQA